MAKNTANYSSMVTDVQSLAEIGRRRQSRKLCILAGAVGLGIVLMCVSVVDPTTQVGAVVLTLSLASALLGLLLGTGSSVVLRHTRSPSRDCHRARERT